MPAKRRAAEMEAESPVQGASTIQKLRDMWQFSNLAQYINIFGDAVKIDRDLDIEDLETECLKPHPSEKLAQVGLALLKHVSSHKGLTPELFDEYTRRQFVAKAPTRNPFGIDEEPNKFDDLDVFTKIRVLQQLSTWTLNNPNTIREKLAATDSEQALWRMEPTGWDSQDRTLYVLDDNRMYRLTDPPPPPPPQKAKPKAKSRKSKGSRASKRQKQSTPEAEEQVEEEEEEAAEDQPLEEAQDDGLGGSKWECICVTLEDYQEYMNAIRKSRDPNEKILHKRLAEEVIPVMEGLAEEQARKQARKQKELENMQKLAMAKRSSRISSRLEKQKEVEEADAAERKRQAELAQAKAEQEKQKKLEEAHDSRRMTREQRLRERETAKVLKEEELRRLQENEQKLANNDARLSERHLKAMMKQHESDLKKLNEEEDWFFDCEKCGTYGSNLNDKTAQISCEKCNVWQHVKCHGISESEVDDPKFIFICSSCKRKEAEAGQAKPPSLKLRLTSASPASGNGLQRNGAEPSALPRRLDSIQIPPPKPSAPQLHHQPVQQAQPWIDGPSLSPRGQALGPPGIQRSEAAYGSPYNGDNGDNGSSSPVRPVSSFSMPNNSFPTSSPPPFHSSNPPVSPTKSVHFPHPKSNGTSFNASNPFGPPLNSTHIQNFNRPTSSSAGPGVSPIKHSPANSPRPANGLPIMYNFNSPHSSFPPSSAHRPSFSPTKHSSPALLPTHMSSPAPAPMRIAPSPSSQMPAQVLPDPIPAPLKHDAIRPPSSHEMSETRIFPPVKGLAPVEKTQILSPPVKKSSPAPERFSLLGGK